MAFYRWLSVDYRKSKIMGDVAVLFSSSANLPFKKPIPNPKMVPHV